MIFLLDSGFLCACADEMIHTPNPNLYIISTLFHPIRMCVCVRVRFFFWFKTFFPLQFVRLNFIITRFLFILAIYIN